jgi:hypothetical protein
MQATVIRGPQGTTRCSTIRPSFSTDRWRAQPCSRLSDHPFAKKFISTEIDARSARATEKLRAELLKEHDVTMEHLRADLRKQNDEALERLKAQNGDELEQLKAQND